MTTKQNRQHPLCYYLALDACKFLLPIVLFLIGQNCYSQALGIDVTVQYLQNPNFDDGADYWAWDGNYYAGGYQSATYTSDEAQISRFVELWVESPYTLNNGYILQQEIACMSKGVYCLEADIIACNQRYSLPSDITGVYLLATKNLDENAIAQTECATWNGVPQHFTVTFGITEEDENDGIFLGIQMRNTDANWIAADNFKLTYYEGITNVEYVYMATAFERLERLCSNYIDQNGLYLYSAKSAGEFQTIKSLANGMSDNTPIDELTSMTDRINALTNTISYEKNAYTQWRNLFTKIEEVYNNYKNVPVGGDYIASLYSIVSTNLEAGLYSDETDLDNCQNRYDEALSLIRMHVLENITEGTDITILLTNPNFDNNSSDGWILDNCTWTNIAAECAEMYQKNFNVYQELTGLPQGRYEVKLQGFVRQGFSQYAFDNHNNGTEDIKAYIYSTSDGVTVKTPFRSIYDGKNKTQVFFNPDNLPEPVGYVDSRITDK